ncbi:unnamed protein product [Caenorhabditis brenneri]
MSKRFLNAQEHAELFEIFRKNGGIVSEEVCRELGVSFQMPWKKIQKWCYRKRHSIKNHIKNGGTVNYQFFYNVSDAKKDQPETTRASPSASIPSDEEMVKEKEEPVEQFSEVFSRFNKEELQNILCAANLKEFQYLLVNGKFSIEPAPGGGRLYVPTKRGSSFSMPTPTITAPSIRKSHSRSSTSSSLQYTEMKTCVITSSPELSPTISNDPSFDFGTS